MGSMQDHADRIRREREAYGPTRYRRGQDFTTPGASYESYGIDVGTFDPTQIVYGKDSPSDPTQWHHHQIQVHGDANLRDRLVNELNAEPSGYAVNVPGAGGIDMRTAGPTRRSALVNWLFNRGLFVSKDWTDEMIETAWRSEREFRLGDERRLKAYCIKIVVHAYQNGPADVSENPDA